MQVSLQFDGPHPGPLMMDEPRHQEVDSFNQFLSLAAKGPGQLILMTSEAADLVRDARWVAGESLPSQASPAAATTAPVAKAGAGPPGTRRGSSAVIRRSTARG